MFPSHRPLWRVLLLSTLLLMIPGFVPFAMAQPEEGDSPEADLSHQSQQVGSAAVSAALLSRADPIDAIDDASPRSHHAVVGEQATKPAVRAEAVRIGEEVAKTGADAWHAAGYRGAGSKVAIIDNWFSTTVWDAAYAAGEVPSPAGVICRNAGVACDIWSVFPDGEHGTAVAEIIHEMAPDATIYLGSPNSSEDYRDVLDYFEAHGVQVVFHGMTWPYDGPGDGSGVGARIVDYAVERDMAWINAAGNLAGGGYWRGAWVDADTDQFLEFAPGDETYEFICGWGFGMRWNDWTDPKPTDYDVFIFDDLAALDAGTIKASSVDDQATGFPPLESYVDSLLDAGCSGPDDTDHLVVFLSDAGAGTAGDDLELGVGTLGEYWQNPFSAAIPFAASENGGGLSVGAIDPPGGIAAAYSSQGPTNDGRMKPDLAAAAGVLNFTYGTFSGTSAAAATTAGAVALVVGANLGTSGAQLQAGYQALAVTPAEIASLLTSAATVDRGAAGPDNIYGHGELFLPAPSNPPVAADDTYAATNDTLLSVGADKGILANDTDSDGDDLTVLASDTTSAKGGAVAVKSDGSFTYMPPAGFVGTDAFTYTASAGLLGDTATVTLVVGGTHTVGLVDPAQGKWYLYTEDGVQQKTFFFGDPRDFPVYGDWNCDGEETPGMYRQDDGFVYLRNSNTQGVADIKFFFGNPGDIPLTGDFNGDGCDTVSIYRPATSEVFIINKLGENNGGLGAADFSYFFGNPGDKPFVGDFDGDGGETVGLHRESTGLVYFRNTHTQGVADNEFIFGDPGDRLVAGDWTGNGTFTPALFRPSNTTMFFRHTNTQGNADAQWVGGQSPWLPIAGNNGLGYPSN